jgi:hypothetical protein
VLSKDVLGADFEWNHDFCQLAPSLSLLQAIASSQGMCGPENLNLLTAIIRQGNCQSLRPPRRGPGLATGVWPPGKGKHSNFPQEASDRKPLTFFLPPEHCLEHLSPSEPGPPSTGEQPQGPRHRFSRPVTLRGTQLILHPHSACMGLPPNASESVTAGSLPLETRALRKWRGRAPADGTALLISLCGHFT